MFRARAARDPTYLVWQLSRGPMTWVTFASDPANLPVFSRDVAHYSVGHRAPAVSDYFSESKNNQLLPYCLLCYLIRSVQRESSADSFGDTENGARKVTSSAQSGDLQKEVQDVIGIFDDIK